MIRGEGWWRFWYEDLVELRIGMGDGQGIDGK